MQDMMKNVLVLVFLLCALPVQAKDLSAFKMPAITANVTEISLSTALHRLLERNLTAGMLAYEDLQADSMYERYQTKFSPFISASTGYQNVQLDPSSMDAIYGSAFTKNDSSVSLGQSFKTGTTVIAGFKDVYTDYTKPSAYLLAGKYEESWHSPALFFQIKQELLKNCFGYTDREQESILKDQQLGKELATEYQLSGVIVSGIFDYWTVAQRQQQLAAAQNELAAYRTIYDAIERNVNLGSYENYNLYQFNALIAASEAKLAAAELNYTKSLNKMLRNIDMTEEVSGNTISLVSMDIVQHSFDEDALFRTALEKRADIRKARLDRDSLIKQKGILENQDLPSVTLQWQGTGLGYDAKYAEATIEAGAFEYSNWETRLTVSKVLFDNDTGVQKRNAEYQVAQLELQLKDLENKVRDEVQDGMAAVEASYVALEKTQIMVRDSQRYLDALLLRLRQGRISTLELKSAVDMTVAANNSHAEALTAYNMALMNLDLVTNTVFEKNDIDIKKTVKERVK